MLLWEQKHSRKKWGRLTRNDAHNFAWFYVISLIRKIDYFLQNQCDIQLIAKTFGYEKMFQNQKSAENTEARRWIGGSCARNHDATEGKCCRSLSLPCSLALSAQRESRRNRESQWFSSVRQREKQRKIEESVAHHRRSLCYHKTHEQCGEEACKWHGE